MYEKTSDFEQFRAQCAEERNGIPGAQGFGHGGQCGVMIIGLPTYDAKRFEGCALAEILNGYKRLMTTGKFGRTKKEHNRILKEMRQAYISAHPELFARRPMGCFLRPEARKKLFGEEVAEQMTAQSAKVKLPLFLPEDAEFTLPVAYTVMAVENPITGGSDLLVYSNHSTAHKSLERRMDSTTKRRELVEMSEETALYWIRMFCDVLAIELQEYFKDIYNESERTGIAPDYYGYLTSCS